MSGFWRHVYIQKINFDRREREKNRQSSILFIILLKHHYSFNQRLRDFAVQIDL